MTPTLEAKIWLALAGHLEKLVFTPGMPIAWPGATFEPGAQPYLSVSEVVVAPRRELINRPLHDHAGTLTVVSVQPVGKDATVYKQIAGQIAEHFRSRCVRYDDVTAYFRSAGGNVAHVAGGYRDGAYFFTPVIVPWRTWA